MVRNISHAFPWVTTTFLTPYGPYVSCRIGLMAGFGVLWLWIDIYIHIARNFVINFWGQFYVCHVSIWRKVLNQKQRTPKNAMGPMLKDLLGSYGVGKVGFSEAKLSIQSLDTDIWTVFLYFFSKFSEFAKLSNFRPKLCYPTYHYRHVTIQKLLHWDPIWCILVRKSIKKLIWAISFLKLNFLFSDQKCSLCNHDMIFFCSNNQHDF